MVYYKTSNKNLMFGEFLKHQVVYFPVKKEGEYYIFKEVSDMSKEELVFRIKKANELYSHYSNYRKLVRQVVNHAKTSSSVL